MKTVSIFNDYGALNSKPVFDAFKVGLIAQGYTVKHNSFDADIAVIWSMLWHGRMAPNRQVYNHFRRLKKDVIILEIGSVRRGSTWRVGVNGISKDQLLYHPSEDTQRLTHLDIAVKPWRTIGNKILICGQNEKSQLWQNMPTVDTWITRTIDTIRLHTKMPIVVRPHPRFPLLSLRTKQPDVSLQQPAHVTSSYDSYDLSFDNLHALVCWSSTPAATAVLNGVPVFTGPDSIAQPVANVDLSKIAEPVMPDRTSWSLMYARSEYTLDELAQGMPLKTLTKL